MSLKWKYEDVYLMTYLSELAAGTADLVLDKIPIEPHRIGCINVEDVAELIEVATNGAYGLHKENPRGSLKGFVLNLGVSCERRLLGGVANFIDDKGGVVAFRSETGSQSLTMGTTCFELLDRSGSALKLSSQGFCGVFEDAVDAMEEGNISTLLNSFMSRVRDYLLY